MSSELGSRLVNLPGPIFLTGHTGFKGTWMTLLLQKLGIEVVGIALPSTNESLFSKVEDSMFSISEYLDIRDRNAVNQVFAKYRPSAVIHLAAQPLVLESYAQPRETFETNVMGTVNVLEACFRTETVKSIIVATTDKVYRNFELDINFCETDALEGKDPYSASKVAVESVVNAWNQIAKVKGGPPVVAVRAGNVIGGGDWASNRLLPDIIRGFISGGPIEIRNPTNTRPWQHVLDPLVGYLLALEANIDSQKFTSINFGPSDENLSVAQVVEIATSVWENKIEVNYRENSRLDFREARSLNLDSNFAKEHLNWNPQITQKEAVASTVNWWKRVSFRESTAIDECNQTITDYLNQLRQLD